MSSWIWTIIVGIVAGWLAGQIFRGHGFGIWADLVVGIVGAVIGNVVLNLLGFQHYGIIGSLITSIIGAAILVWVIRLFTPGTAPEK